MWGTVAQIAVQAGTSLLSGVQAMKMRKEQRQAEQEVSKLMKDIYGELDKNQYAAVSLPMKAFDIEREALAAQGAQAIEAGRESERFSPGSTMAQYRKALRDIQSEQADKMLDLDLLTAQEAARKDDLRAQFKAQEAEGAQMAAADYEQRYLASVGGAIQSGLGAVGAGMEAIPLFKATEGVRAVSNLEDLYNKTLKKGTLGSAMYDKDGKPLGAYRAIAKKMGMTDDDLKIKGIINDAGVFDDDAFKTWLATQSKADLDAIYRGGFEGFEIAAPSPKTVENISGIKSN